MLDSMKRRRRGRALVDAKRRLMNEPTLREERLRGRLAYLEELYRTPEQSAVDHPFVPGSITARFAELLGDWEPDLDGVDDSVRRAWTDADDAQRTYLRVMLAVWQDAPGFCERSGLRRADPPEGVHAMARGALAAGGGLDSADTIADALADCGIDVASVERALDFGGSSGRVVRVLQAAFPSVEWHSCDPNAEAIAWADEHLPGIDFRVSPQDPPLPYPDAYFDIVYAVSVWSHLSAAGAQRWFDEMYRILRPGGMLVPTVQSWQTLDHLAARGLWHLRDVWEAISDLMRDGHHFRHIFGDGGDHGVKSDDWGFAALSPEWLLAHLTPAWQVLLWRPGGLEGNQDVVVLRRR